MQNFNNLIIETTLVHFEHEYHLPPSKDTYSVDLSHYSFETGYLVKLNKLKELALSDIMFLPEDHIRICVKRLEMIWKRTRKLEVICNAPPANLSKYMTSRHAEENPDERALHDSFLDSIFLELETGFTVYNPDGYRLTQDLFNAQKLIWNLRDAMSGRREVVENLLKEIGEISGVGDTGNETEFATPNRMLSYNWIDGDIRAGVFNLFKVMNGSYIVKTSFEDFGSVFYRADIQSTKPLKWKSNNATELLYFLTALMERGLIDDERKKMSYERLRGCFVKVSGETFKEDLRSLKSKLDIDFSTQRRNKIDSDLSQFL